MPFYFNYLSRCDFLLMFYFLEHCAFFSSFLVMWALRPACYFSLRSCLIFFMERSPNYNLTVKIHHNFTRLCFGLTPLLIFLQAWCGLNCFIFRMDSGMVFQNTFSVSTLVGGYFKFKDAKCILTLLCLFSVTIFIFYNPTWFIIRSWSLCSLSFICPVFPFFYCVLKSPCGFLFAWFCFAFSNRGFIFVLVLLFGPTSSWALPTQFLPVSVETQL